MATDWIGCSQVVTVMPLDYSTVDYSASLLMTKYGFAFLGGLTDNCLLQIGGVDPSTIQYCDRTLLSRMFGQTGLVGISSLKRGDILLQVNDVKVSGMSMNHAEALLLILHERGKPIRLTAARPSHPSDAVYLMPKYVGHCSEQDSPQFELQEVICDNALLFHPPLSTRPVRDDEGETQGNPYHFLSEAQFSALQRRDDLLAAGQYDGYSYGMSCISFAEFDENGNVIRLPESRADAILKMSTERNPLSGEIASLRHWRFFLSPSPAVAPVRHLSALTVSKFL